MTIWQDRFINVNKYARSGKKLTAVKKLVIHYTANNGASANNHYKYFNNLTDRYASAHFFVDKDEAICIIPLNEIAYHCNDTQQRDKNGNPYRGVAELKPNGNLLSLGLEMCLEKDGSFHPNTIKQSEDVMAELCKRYKLDPLTDIVRHYDVTKKNCPAPWVKDISQFEQFKKNVAAKLKSSVTVADKPKTDVKAEIDIKPNEPIKNTEEEDDIMKLTAGDFNRLATAYDVAVKDGLLSDSAWVTKAKKGEITVSEAIYLDTIINHRFRARGTHCECDICKGK